MAVGDVVSVIQASTANYSHYQPAAGVEVMILAVASQNDTYVWRANGVIGDSDLPWLNLNFTSTGGAASIGAVNMKWGVTNSVYMGIYGVKSYHGFSGIQIK